jgi:hypothetical protein
MVLTFKVSDIFHPPKPTMHVILLTVSEKTAIYIALSTNYITQLQKDLSGDHEKAQATP